MAAVSHFPRKLAYAEMLGLHRQAGGLDFLRLAWPGFKDFSRIAASNAEMWRDILLANREEGSCSRGPSEGVLTAWKGCSRRGMDRPPAPLHRPDGLSTFSVEF